MIKAEDIKIGDIVRVSAKCAFDKGTICTVVAVSNVFYCKKQRGIVELRPINSYEMPQGVGSCDIEGIPLTPAILEKNGFNSKESPKSHIKYLGDSLFQYLFIERTYFGWVVFIKVEGLSDSVMIRQIKYVHEFQHILWAMGIGAGFEI